MLSLPFHIHAILKLALVPSQGNAFGEHFLQLYRKNEYGDPNFLFHNFNRDSGSMRKKLAQIYVHFFGNFTKLYG